MSTGWKVFLALLAIWFVWSWYERKRITDQLSKDLAKSGYTGPTKGSTTVTPVSNDVQSFTGQFTGTNLQVV